MPDNQCAFIWYNADELEMDDLKAWLKLVKNKTGQNGRLYVRRKEGKTTFMESYSNLSEATATAIERLAATHPPFQGIERRCESFLRIDKP